MACKQLSVLLVVLLYLACDASVSDVQAEACAGKDIKLAVAGPNLKNLGADADQKGKLELCQGDCDTDDGCAGNLQCFQRDGFTIPPGCSGGGGVGEEIYDYCYDPVGLKLPTLKDLGANPDLSKEKLGLCVGDCDSDDDCEGGLTCYQRSDAPPHPGPSVPGCAGAPNGAYDYCYQYKLFELNDKGKDPKDKLGQCQGDCDKDDDCTAGLKCHQRDGTTSVPGCAGEGGKDWDYCTHPTFGKINSR